MSRGLCVIAALAGSAGAAVASDIHLGEVPFVVNGTIFRVTPQLGGDFDGASTVDRLYITVDTAGVYSFNALSWEVADFDQFSMDVNGDGEIAFLDTYLRLFVNDGDLSADDQVARNDDTFSNTKAFADGTIYGYDSFLSLYLDPGQYILAIGAYHMSIPDAILGLDVDNNYYPVSFDDNTGEFLPSDHGDYRLTMGLVPTPGSAALLGMGLLTVIRRRR
jgi:hypothetical protein